MQDVYAFLVSYTILATFAVFSAFAYRESASRVRWWVACWLLALLIGGVAAVAIATPGENVIVQLIRSAIRLDRVRTVAVTAGAACGLLAGLSLNAARSPVRIAARLILHTLAVLALCLLTLKDVVSPYLSDPDEVGVAGGLIRPDSAPGLVVSEYATLTIAPTCLAIGPGGHIYVAGYGGLAYQNGVVVRLDRSPSGGPPRETRVADYLNRPHGLAFHGNDLYVSRAGQFSRAMDGKIVQEPTGTVTRMRDLDGDGIFDHYHDIVTGLPGAALPDGLHQNNGILFDDEGALFITVGAPTDHSPFSHRYAGTILKARPDGSGLEIFARGLRNPFDLTLGPDGALFGTDNDANTTGSGDALLHLVEGAHYGFPYAVADRTIAVSGVTKPLWQSSPALEGITYIPPSAGPDAFSDRLYIASYGSNSIKRVALRREARTYSVIAVDNVVSIPGVIDVAYSSEEGVLYACSHEQRKVYRITPLERTASSSPRSSPRR